MCAHARENDTFDQNGPSRWVLDWMTVKQTTKLAQRNGRQLSNALVLTPSVRPYKFDHNFSLYTDISVLCIMYTYTTSLVCASMSVNDQNVQNK